MEAICRLRHGIWGNLHNKGGVWRGFPPHPLVWWHTWSVATTPFPKRTVQHNFYVYADTVVFTVNPDRDIHPRSRLEVAVIRNKERPAADRHKFALPGGLVQDNERLEDAALRIVHEKTGIIINPRTINQVRAYGDPHRDGRSRAIAVCHMALLPYPGEVELTLGQNEAWFMPYRQLRDKDVLQYDHSDMLHDARKAALTLMENTNVALGFCEPNFTMPDLRNIYEAFLQFEIDPANFRRKVEQSGLVVETDKVADTSSQRGRPASLYQRSRRTQLDYPIRFTRKG